MKIFVLILLLFLTFPLAAQQNISEGFKLIDGAELYYQMKGDGQPMIVLHGGPGMDASYLHPSMDPLSKTFRLITYDQRGSGKSKGSVDTLKLSMDQFVKDLEGLRQALGIEKMHLMGHSYGGLLAMFYALQYPQHLQSLMLVSSAGADPSYAEAQFKTVNERLSSEDREKVPKMTAPGMLDSKEGWINLMKVIWKPYVFDQQKVKLVKDAVSDHTSLIQKHVGKSINGYNLHDQLANLKVPTLIIHGAYDPVPLSASQKTHQAIKGSKLVVLEECGHFPFIEQPQLFTKKIIEFTQWVKNK